MESNPITPLTPVEISDHEAKAAQESYPIRVLVGVDELANELLGGSPDETISSRMARWATEDDGWKRDVGVAVSKALNLAQPDHGAEAEAGDLERARAVTAIEEKAEGIK